MSFKGPFQPKSFLNECYFQQDKGFAYVKSVCVHMCTETTVNLTIFLAIQHLLFVYTFSQ